MYAITIEIHYTAAGRLMQCGSFPLRGRRPEQVALAFWKEIRKQMSNRAQLEQVLVNGDQDITELVADIEREELRNIDANWNLPF